MLLQSRRILSALTSDVVSRVSINCSNAIRSQTCAVSSAQIKLNTSLLLFYSLPVTYATLCGTIYALHQSVKDLLECGVSTSSELV